MGKRDWVKSIVRKPRDDIGDCPTLPKELLDILSSVRRTNGIDQRSGLSAEKYLSWQRAFDAARPPAATTVADQRD
jgi:hypothetical protein